MQQKWNGRSAKSAAALLLASRIGAQFDAHRDRRVGKGNMGAHFRAERPKAESSADSRASMSVTASACELVHTDVARGFIDFATLRQKP